MVGDEVSMLKEEDLVDGYVLPQTHVGSARLDSRVQ